MFNRSKALNFGSVFKEEIFSDAKIFVEGDENAGKYIRAHKVILAVASPFFRETFQNNPQEEAVTVKNVPFETVSSGTFTKFSLLEKFLWLAFTKTKAYGDWQTSGDRCTVCLLFWLTILDTLQ